MLLDPWLVLSSSLLSLLLTYLALATAGYCYGAGDVLLWWVAD